VKRLFYAGSALVMAAGLVTALVVVVPTVTASAKKAPATATCTALFGGATSDTLSGCSVTSGKPKITAQALDVVNSNDTGATIYWTNGKTTIETFTYGSPVTDSCPTDPELGQGTEITESATITGGTAKITTGAVSGSTDVCLWTDSTFGNADGIIVQNLSGSNLNL